MKEFYINKNEEKKRLISNIFSLGLLQGANYILPLMTVPYLVRVLGPNYFGLLAFSSATISYFSLITDYGFNLSATQQIAICRDNKDKINKIFSAVMIVKTLLMLISLCLLTILVLTISKFNQHLVLYFVTFGTVIGQVLFPQWLFQGMESMKYITYLNIGSKFLFTICVFLFVKDKSDYILVPIFTSSGFVLSGVLGFLLARKEFSLSIKKVEFKDIKYQLIEGWHVFLSTIAVSFYTISTIFILGLFSNNMIVGYFSAANKIIQSVSGLYSPISQSLYPVISNKINKNKESGLYFVKKIIKNVGLISVFFCFLLFYFSSFIVQILLGKQYIESIILLKVMSFIPCLIFLSNMLGVQIMLNVGLKKTFSFILCFAAILGLILSFILVPHYNELGTAITILCVETFVTVSMFFCLKAKKYI